MPSSILKFPFGQAELRYLVLLLASEQSEVSELSLELANLGIDAVAASDAIRSLASGGTIGAINKAGCANRELSLVQMYALAESVLDRREDQTELFLTKAGWERWEAQDWGISAERASQVYRSLTVATRVGGGPSLWSRLRSWFGQ